jgi:[acyl-carrier-protein] S-malonyltransferase
MLFPGQGAQRVGMAQDTFKAFQSARDVFALADDVLGSSVSELCFGGPEELLTDTENAQPAILAASLAYLASGLEAKSLTNRPTFLAGHSLGEYTALVAAGSLAVSDALKLVRERGRLMAEAGRASEGTMAAILGLDERQVESICKTSGAEPANFNGPTQTVVGGVPAAVDRAVEIAKEMGGKALPVKVSGAFHTSMMSEAAERFSAVVDSVSVKAPQIAIIGNVTGLPLQTTESVTTELKRQIAKPVQWNRTMRHMLDHGVRSFVEVGPGRSLSAMLKRIDPDTQCGTIDSVESLSTSLHV